jgi:hypothetical protein
MTRILLKGLLAWLLVVTVIIVLPALLVAL